MRESANMLNKSDLFNSEEVSKAEVEEHVI
jgi:hypothetical protein